MKNNILVATASRSGGALTIYRQFLSHLKNHIGDDRYYVFIHPDMPREEIENVTYIEYDTSSHIRRILFDWLLCKRILKRLNVEPDRVISLQNTGVKCLSSYDTLIYYHQSIPFYPQKWNPFIKSERTLFYYKYIYPYFVKASLTSKTEVVVQIPFIKRGFVKKFNFPEDKVHVLFPDLERIETAEVVPYDFGDDRIHMLYPATAWSYKNHKAIAEALNLARSLDPEVFSRLSVHFTMSRGDSCELDELIDRYDLSQTVVYDGFVDHNVLLSMYKSASALLFPSEIETLGLPLVEAAIFGLPILVSDLDYSREVLKEYKGQRYILPDDYMNWAKGMIDIASKSSDITPLPQTMDSSWTHFFSLLNK